MEIKKEFILIQKKTHNFGNRIETYKIVSYKKLSFCCNSEIELNMALGEIYKKYGSIKKREIN